MTESPGNHPPKRWLKIIRRTLTTLMMAALVGWFMHQIARHFDRSPEPAGFGRGLLQGALMPAAMPNLLVGSDVTIYAQKNTGVPYKLGYTLGVDACGAIFFGYFFFRLNRLRKGLSEPQPAANSRSRPNDAKPA